MSAGPENITPISGIDLDGPLPWSMVIDRDLRVRQLGRSLARHAPSISLGERLDDSLRIDRPKMSIRDFEDLTSLQDRLIMVSLGEHDMQMRGAVFTQPGGESVIFIGSPVLTSSDDLARTGIELGDFAPHDILPDLLFAIQARDVSIDEARESFQNQAHISKRLKAILDSAWDAMITFNTLGEIVEINDVAIRTFEFERTTIIGQCISDLLVPVEYRKLFECALLEYDESKIASLMNETMELMAMSANGRKIPIEFKIVPFHHDGSQYFTATVRDLTEQKRKDALIAENRKQEKLLHRELDHRVKNMLSQIVVLCRQALSKSTDDRKLISSLTNRVENFSAIHELLSNNSITGIELEALASTCMSPYMEGSNSRFETGGHRIILRPSFATTLAIVLNELATNAFKYGAIKNDGGRITLTWNMYTDDDDTPNIKIQWKEHHDGSIPDSIEGGLGTEILNSVLIYQYNGSSSLERLDDGLIYEAVIPVSNLVIQPD